jgi:hypothetical protein
MRIFFTIAFTVLLFALGTAQPHRNCGTMDLLETQLEQDPGLYSRMQQIERQTEAFVRQGGHQGRTVVTIPVVFHIVHNGDAIGANENLSEALVLAQLDQLNKDFRLTNADTSLIPSLFQDVAADAEIEFCLAQRKPDGTATNGINRINGGRTSWTRSRIESSLKPSTIWDRNQYLNVWTVIFGSGDASLLGYAQFPGGTATTDGVVVTYTSVGSTTQPNPGGGVFGQGRTLTHEVGHWLNLRHIWGDASCGNDLVSDTPVHNTSNTGCPAYPHYSTCSGAPVEMTMNYMDYTNDGCMYMFTAGQKTRMQAVLAVSGSRSSLASSQGCTAPNGGGGAICNTPTGLGSSQLTTNSANLSWQASSGAGSYNIRLRPTGSSSWTTGSTSSTSVAATGLTAGTQYEFQVQAVCSSSLSSNFSSSATFTTLSNSCADTYEPNNSRSGSLPLIPIAAEINARISTATDRDWYRFANTAAQRNIRIDLFNLPADYDLQFFQNATRRATSQNDATNPEFIIFNTNTVASNWYAYVYGYNGAFNNTSCYTLRVTLSSSGFRTDGSTDGETSSFELPVQLAGSSFELTPNPARDEVMVTVDLYADGPVDVSVLNLSGQVVAEKTQSLSKGAQQVAMDVSRLPAGIYLLRVRQGDQLSTQKLSIVK